MNEGTKITKLQTIFNPSYHCKLLLEAVAPNINIKQPWYAYKNNAINLKLVLITYIIFIKRCTISITFLKFQI